MGSSSDRTAELKLTPFKASKELVSLYFLFRGFFVSISVALGLFAAWRLTPLLEGSDDVEAAPLVGSAIFFGFAAFLLFAAQPVGPSFKSQQQCLGDKVATFSRTQKSWLFCEPTEKFRKAATKDTLFVFYCCPKLDPTSYAGLAKEIAKHGICTVLLQPPLGLFFAQPPKASDVIAEMSPTFERFILGGHDMGAQFVCDFAKQLSGRNELAGVVAVGTLIKTKKNNLSELRGGDGELPVALVNGSRDKLLCQHIDMRHKGSFKSWITSARAFLPEKAYVKTIKDGNHFHYCDRELGLLEGFPTIDNVATITREQQQRETALVVSQVALCSPSNPLPTGR